MNIHDLDYFLRLLIKFIAFAIVLFLFVILLSCCLLRLFKSVLANHQLECLLRSLILADLNRLFCLLLYFFEDLGVFVDLRLLFFVLFGFFGLA